ncbi:hypothetical protein GZ22_18125 (plasmid) [Terribacillus saccharophilus]|uniref:Uncharacterized protein n=1 Tax=Terribacillus saccharophilus TaxID=361277 RepID=A0A075LQF9_9BACI|nr:hypothetical protein [Terribacillus goriensis]AIF68361.1 hypothetical protein GZ22_18125 [Terribacillus goriensis]
MVNVERVKEAFELLRKPDNIPFPYISEHLNVVKRRENASFETFRPNFNRVEYNAVIGWEGQSYTYGYKEGFFNIAHAAIEPAAHIPDTLVFSIIFNYRQYLELVLKENITRFEILWECPMSNNKTHDLSILLDRLLELLKTRDYNFLISEVQKKVINDFMEIDSKNDAFRFVYDFEGQLSHKYDHKIINLLDLHYTMNEIYNDFNAIDYLFGADEALENRYSHPSIEGLLVALNSYLTNGKNRKGINSLAKLKHLIFEFTFAFNEKSTLKFDADDTNVTEMNETEYGVSNDYFTIVLHVDNEEIKSMRVKH